ncbi:MAG TPA: hypothetical protein VJ772_05250 [Nitrososphaeraceae archaeon]|jgi:hypothetical protein|nr:hypothetical protein [Nitrososphaeraceae archaeon]
MGDILENSEDSDKFVLKKSNILKTRVPDLWLTPVVNIGHFASIFWILLLLTDR